MMNWLDPKWAVKSNDQTRNGQSNDQTRNGQSDSDQTRNGQSNDQTRNGQSEKMIRPEVGI